MKNKIFLTHSFSLLFFIMGITGSVSINAKDQLSKIFSFKSAIIEFEVIYPDNVDLKCNRTLYVDDYGKKLCMDYNIFQEGEEKKHFRYIFTESKSISINMNMKYAVKRKNPSNLFDDEALGEWFKEIVFGEKKKKIVISENLIKIDKLLDKECMIYEFNGERYWIWNDLILKWEKKNRFQIAKKIQIEVPINQEVFKVPKGIWVFPKIL